MLTGGWFDGEDVGSLHVFAVGSACSEAGTREDPLCTLGSYWRSDA